MIKRNIVITQWKGALRDGKDGRNRNPGFLQHDEHHCFYVDKTGFIKEWWENKNRYRPKVS